MAQPLKEGAPSFCLECIGTDNKLTSQEVLKDGSVCIMKQPKGVLELLASQLMVTHDECVLCVLLYHY